MHTRISIRDVKFRSGTPAGLRSHEAGSDFTAQANGADLRPCPEDATIVYYAVVVGLRAVPERCRPGSMLGPPDFVQCQFGFGLAFEEILASL